MAQPTQKQLGIVLGCLVVLGGAGGASWRFVDAFATDAEVEKAVTAEAARADARIDLHRAISDAEFRRVDAQLTAINEKLDELLGRRRRSRGEAP